ncbi:hypothetical protein DMUE_3134 [Dictyocoela muelleri]|nr:hypothetical protein DMUE_3134 [Dictyocoela muelleri]
MDNKYLFSKMINLEISKKNLVRCLKNENIKPKDFNNFVISQVSLKSSQKKTLKVIDLLDNDFLNSIVETPNIKSNFKVVDHSLCYESGKLYTFDRVNDILREFCREYRVRAEKGFVKSFYKSLKFFLYKKYRKLK